MKNAIQLLFLLTILISCKNSKTSTNPNATKTVPSITYDAGLQNCLKIKADNPDDFFATKDCLVGVDIPNFTTTSIDGKSIDSESLKGKLTIINFWFTTCAPCVAEIPGFNAIVKKYGKDKINFISIAKNKKPEIEAFLEKHPWDFAHISNEDDLIKKTFKIQFGYPTTYLLNKDAQIIKSFSGGAIGTEAAAQIQNKLIPAIDAELK